MSEQSIFTYTVHGQETVDQVIATMIQLANDGEGPIQATFNGIQLIAYPGITSASILARYVAAFKQRNEVYLRFPESMPHVPSAPLTGLALADALFAQGLVLPGIVRLHSWEGEGVHYYITAQSTPWRPWESWDAVAHLLERYNISVCHSYGDWFVYREHRNVLEDEPAVPFADLPAAIARRALRLHAAEKEEPLPCPAP